MMNKGKRIHLDIDLENSEQNDKIWKYLQTKFTLGHLIYIDQLLCEDFMTLLNIVGELNGMRR